MKAKHIKISALKFAALTAMLASMLAEPLSLSAESGVLEKKENSYKGEDMCIAILDRGFYFEHESLIITDKVPKLSKKESDSLFKGTIAYKELSEKNGESEKTKSKKKKRLSVYVNEKVPFAYDYGDNDTDLSGTFASHGMAMISIATGTDTLYGGTASINSGTAPEAQVLAMKVYSDETEEVSSEAMSAAVNDAVTMGADVIYIAVTEICGFEEKQWGDFEDALENAWEKGVIVVSAAGDILEYGRESIFDKYGWAYYVATDSPDIGTIAYPSSSPKVISVGSVDRYEIISDFLTLDNGEKVPYSDSNYMYEIGGVRKSFAEHFDGQELEYVICEGVGKPEELAKAGDLKGKVAVVSRGEITFSEKAQNAAALGAVAVVVYDNDAVQYVALETMLALDEAPIPTIFIESDDCEKMVSSEKKKFRTNIGEAYSTVINKYPFVSAFSPYGTTPELGLKPDIVAVGTLVKCAVPSGGYGYMSSTTAAGAKVAGICAGIKEYLLDSNEEFTEIALADRVRYLLVNSASIMDDMAAGELYSPRKQGGGFVSLENAVNTELILTSDGNFKAEVGDGSSVIVEFEVTAENLSGSARECLLDCIVGTDDYSEFSYSDFEADSTGKTLWERLGKSPNEKISFITHYKALGKVETYLDGVRCKMNVTSEDYQPYAFTLGAGESRTFRVKLILDDETYKTYYRIFENGFFVEGFLRLCSEDEISSIPFLTFCGDFGKAESLDAEIYSGKDAVYDSCYLYYCPSDSSEDMRILGEMDADGDTYYDRSAMAFSPKVNPHSIIGINLGLKRSINELTISVTNKDGDVISLQKHENVARSYISASTGAMITPNYLIWNGRAADNHGYIYEDGVYTITVTYKRVTSDAERSFSYSIYIDSTAPKIEMPAFEVKDGSTFMKLTVEDNHRLESVKVFDSRFKEAENSSDGLFDISEMIGEYIYVEAIDAVGNKTTVRVDNPNYS